MIELNSNEDCFRTRDHVRQFLETAQMHGANGKNAVLGALAGIREFVEEQTSNDHEELERLANVFVS